jgi:hypothetical protein
MTSDTSQPLRGPAAEREVRELGPLLEWAQPLTTTPRGALIDVARLVRAALPSSATCGRTRGLSCSTCD